MKTVKEIAKETGKSPERIRMVICKLGINKTYSPNHGARTVLQITDEDSLKLEEYFNRKNYAIREKKVKHKFSPGVKEMLFESYL